MSTTISESALQLTLKALEEGYIKKSTPNSSSAETISKWNERNAEEISAFFVKIRTAIS